MVSREIFLFYLFSNFFYSVNVVLCCLNLPHFESCSSAGMLSKTVEILVTVTLA